MSDSPPEAPLPRLRVAIAEDSALLREGLKRVLGDAGMVVVGTAGDAEALVDLVEDTRPDVVIVDIRMPPTQTTEGLVAARRIRRERPETGVLVLSHHVETVQAVELLGDDPAGIGYLLKDRVADIDRLVDAVARVARRESVIDPEIVARLVAKPRQGGQLSALSDREMEVLALMAEGRSNLAISERLYLSQKTVETHVSSILTKLGLLPAPDDHRRVLAVLAFLTEVGPVR